MLNFHRNINFTSITSINPPSQFQLHVIWVTINGYWPCIDEKLRFRYSELIDAVAEEVFNESYGAPTDQLLLIIVLFHWTERRKKKWNRKGENETKKRTSNGKCASIKWIKFNFMYWKTLKENAQSTTAHSSLGIHCVHRKWNIHL